MKNITLFGSLENPFREFNRMQRELDRMFDDISPSALAPACDVTESESHYLMSLDLPGVKKEDLKVNLQDNVLTISGERKDEHEEKRKNRYRSERYYGSFARSFSVPAGVKAEQIETEFKDGVLHIAVPKIAAAKELPIKVGSGKPGLFERLLGGKKESGEKVA